MLSRHFQLLQYTLECLHVCSGTSPQFCLILLSRFCCCFDYEHNFAPLLNRDNLLDRNLWVETLRAIDFSGHVNLYLDCLRIHFYYLRVGGHATHSLSDGEIHLLTRLTQFSGETKLGYFFLVFSSVIQADNFKSLWSNVAEVFSKNGCLITQGSFAIYPFLVCLRKWSRYQPDLPLPAEILSHLQWLAAETPSFQVKRVVAGLFAHFTRSLPPKILGSDPESEINRWASTLGLNFI